MFEIEKALKEKNFENKIKNIDNIHEMIELCLEQGHFCKEVHKRIYDLTEPKEYRKIFSDFIHQYGKTYEEEEDLNVVGCLWGPERNQKVYNLLHIEDLMEMKEKEYIITNFGCDEGLCYFTKEQFKAFVKEWSLYM